MLLASSYCGNCVVSPRDFSLGTRGAGIYHNRATSRNMQQWAEKACKVVRENWATMVSWNKNNFIWSSIFFFFEWDLMFLSEIIKISIDISGYQVYCISVKCILNAETARINRFCSYLSKNIHFCIWFGGVVLLTEPYVLTPVPFTKINWLFICGRTAFFYLCKLHLLPTSPLSYSMILSSRYETGKWLSTCITTKHVWEQRNLNQVSKYMYKLWIKNIVN